MPVTTSAVFTLVSCPRTIWFLLFLPLCYRTNVQRYKTRHPLQENRNFPGMLHVNESINCKTILLRPCCGWGHFHLIQTGQEIIPSSASRTIDLTIELEKRFLNQFHSLHAPGCLLISLPYTTGLQLLILNKKKLNCSCKYIFCN